MRRIMGLFVFAIAFLLEPAVAHEVDPRLSWLQDVDPDVRIAGAEALARTANLNVVEALVRAQSDRVYRVAEAARRSTDQLLSAVMSGWLVRPATFDVRVVAVDSKTGPLRLALVERFMVTPRIVAGQSFQFDDEEAAPEPDVWLDVLLQVRPGAIRLTLADRSTGIVMLVVDVPGVHGAAPEFARVGDRILEILGIIHKRSSRGSSAR